MRDTAIKLIGLRALRMDAWEDDDYDRMFEFDEEIGDTAHELALEVIEYNALDGHTRLEEIARYASRERVCMHQAIIRLVNAALSHGLDKEV
jgi:hypothetical protein